MRKGFGLEVGLPGPALSKTGTFSAVGYERVVNLLILLPLIGIFQLPFIFVLGFYPVSRQFLPSDDWGYVGGLSFAILAVSGLLATKIGVRTTKAEIHQISFVDDREEGGKLCISYTNANGEQRNSLVVRKVKAEPGKYLAPKVGLGNTPIPGARSSLTIMFEKEKSPSALILGYPNPEEMAKAYALLRD